MKKTLGATGLSTAFLADVREGLADIEAGRVHEHADVMAEARAVIARAKGPAKAGTT